MALAGFGIGQRAYAASTPESGGHPVPASPTTAAPELELDPEDETVWISETLAATAPFAPAGLAAHLAGLRRWWTGLRGGTRRAREIGPHVEPRREDPPREVPHRQEGDEDAAAAARGESRRGSRGRRCDRAPR